MGTGSFVHHPLFFLVALIILLLAFFASGLHQQPQPPKHHKEFLQPLVPYRFTQPQPEKDPKGDILWGEECGNPGKTNDLLDCVEKESFGYCLQGRCRQTGLRFEKKCLCR